MDGLWIVELRLGNKWFAWSWLATRKNARSIAGMYRKLGRKCRVVKYSRSGR